MRSYLLLLALAVITMSSSPARAGWVPDGTPLSTAANDQSSPMIVSDGAGGAIVTWSDARSGGTDIYAQRVNAWGTALWTADGVALCTAAANQQYPTIIADGAGGAIVTWQDHRNGGSADIYAQRVDALGIPQWTADGVALCTESTAQEYPTIVSDGAGGAIVTWHDVRALTNWDIYAQRINASGIPQWTTDGVALVTEWNSQQYPTIVSDGAGGAIVTWHDERNFGANFPDIYARRIDASGNPLWAVDGVALCTHPSPQGFPMIVSDGAGGAIVTWQDNRSGYEIYARRVDASGTPQWTADGVALCTAPLQQVRPTIVSDGAGGAIVTWQDERSGPTHIYAQRVNASGTPEWTANGVALCTASVGQEYPTIASDGAGGAIVTWHDWRSGTHKDIYAQQVNASGTPQWTANGVALSTPADHQTNPTIVSDGAGGAIVTWWDNRSGTNYDIYAVRLSDSGSIPTGVRDTPPATALTVLQNHPNPFNGTTTLEIGLAAASPVEIEVFDVAGRKVRGIKVDDAQAGWRSVPFDGRDDRGRSLASGMYFYRVSANGTTVTRKMVIMR